MVSDAVNENLQLVVAEQRECALACILESGCKFRLSVDLCLSLIVTADMIYSVIQAGLQRLCTQQAQREAAPLPPTPPPTGLLFFFFSGPLLAGTRHLHHTLTVAGIV